MGSFGREINKVLGNDEFLVYCSIGPTHLPKDVDPQVAQLQYSETSGPFFCKNYDRHVKKIMYIETIP